MNEQVEQIYNLYVDQQLIDPNNVDKETFAQANPEQASRLYELGVEKNLFQNVDQETFMSAFNFMDVKKKRFIRLYYGSGRYGIRCGRYFVGVYRQ